MKKAIACFAILVLFIVCFSLASAQADERLKPVKSVFRLPTALQEVEEEAFSGTPVRTVIFPEGFLSVGDRAFQGALRLRDIYIPATTEFISDSAFPVRPGLVIHGVKGSYAEDWAEAHRIPFVAENMGKLILDNGRTVSVHGVEFDLFHRTVDSDEADLTVSRSKDVNESKRPQDRPELNPIDYRFP